MTTYMNFQGPGFTLQIPTDWFITSSPEIQAAFIAPVELGHEDVQPNLLVSIRRLEDNVTVQGIAEASKANQQQSYPKYKILSEHDVSKNKLAGFQRIYKWHKESEKVGVCQQQTFYVINNALYTLTATRPDVENMESVDTIFKKIADSFEIVK